MCPCGREGRLSGLFRSLRRHQGKRVVVQDRRQPAFDLSHVPADALGICERLRHAGKRARFVGGCVRDTLLGLAGAWSLGSTRGAARTDAWRWLGLVVLVVLPRWIYLATLENTEPRYMVEIFPFLCVLGGIALAGPGRESS